MKKVSVVKRGRVELGREKVILSVKVERKSEGIQRNTRPEDGNKPGVVKGLQRRQFVWITGTKKREKKSGSELWG